jgi:hypothetical protein
MVSCILERKGNINIGKIRGLMELAHRLTLMSDWNNVHPKGCAVQVN